MLVVYFIFVSLLVVVFETTLGLHFSTDILPPDCHFILIAYLAYRLDILPSLIILIPLSCSLDAVSGTAFFGMYALFCYSGYTLLHLIAKKLPMPEDVYRLPLTGFSYLLLSWLMYALLLLPEDIIVAPWAWDTMLMRAGLVVVLTWPLFLLFDLLRKLATRSPLPLRKLRLRSNDNRRRPRSET